MNRLPGPTAVVVALALAGCAGSRPASAPLGRAITAQPSVHAPAAARPALVRTPASVGDPPSERGGTIPPNARKTENSVSPAGVASSPRLALRRYALAYINWHADGLRERERQLARLSIGAAKLTAQQTAAAHSGLAALIANHVANSGQVIAIAPTQGPDRGQWVIVTQEHTTGTGVYAGLPPAPHVTLARVTHRHGGWVVSAWAPAS